jgi:transposase
MVRRFRCLGPACPTKIFAERLAGDIALPFSRRTTRLERIVHYLGLSLGGRPAAGLAERLMFPVSNDTLLRVVRRHAEPSCAAPRAIGIDDWAWKRGQRYGTVVCDLEDRRIIDLLPDREAGTLDAYLGAHPSIEIIARDRGGGYRGAATRARPEAMQVADRWHLMENASAAFGDAVRKSMRTIRSAIGGATIDVTLLTAAERLRYEGFLRRQRTNETVIDLRNRRMGIKAIVRETGLNRKTVRQIIRGQRTDVFQTRESSLDAFLVQLDTEWNAGCHNGAELWRRLRASGFRGSLRVVSEWSTRRRRTTRPNGGIARAPSARIIARLMLMARDSLTRADAIVVAAIEAAVPALATARELVEQFQTMIRSRNRSELDPWIAKASSGLLSSFARGIADDQKAVAAAIVEPWSNGQTEGQITKLKLVKRQMYGRAKLDLLRARLVQTYA